MSDLAAAIAGSGPPPPATSATNSLAAAVAATPTSTAANVTAPNALAAAVGTQSSGPVSFGTNSLASAVTSQGGSMGAQLPGAGTPTEYAHNPSVGTYMPRDWGWASTSMQQAWGWMPSGGSTGAFQIDRAALQRVVRSASFQIRFDEFCGIFQLLFGGRQAEQNLLMELWGSVFDDQNRGAVSWPSLALKLAAACGHGPVDTLELAFHLFDINGDNRMSRQEFQEMLSPVIPEGAHSYLARVQEAAFQSADSNQDQALSLPEFSQLFLQPLSLPQHQRSSENPAAQVASEMEQFLQRYKSSFDAAMAGIQQRWQQRSSQRSSMDRRQPVSSLPTGKHSFRFAIDLYSIQMTSLRTASIYLCYKYPFFGATTPVRTNPPVDTVSSVETILPSEQFCAFEFTMDATTLYNELASNPLAVEVWNRDKFRSDTLVGVARVRLDDIFVQPTQHGPNGSTIQVLDQQYVIVNTDSGSQRRSGNVRIMLSLERMPAALDHSQNPHQSGGMLNSAGGGMLNSGGAGMLNSAGNQAEASAAWQLEMWREVEEAKWRAELSEKEHARMAALEAEWKARESEREAEVARVKAEYQRLEAKLKSHLLDIEKREPRLALAEKEIERERVRMREELDLAEKSKADEILRARNKYSQDAVSLKLRLQESQNFCEALEERLRDSEERNRSLDMQFQEFKRKANNSSEAKLHERVAEMAQQRLVLEREKDSALNQKRQYKEQLVRALRELQQLKVKSERETSLRLQQEKQELDAMRLQYLGFSQGHSLQADRSELEGIKQQLAQLHVPGGMPVVSIPESQWNIGRQPHGQHNTPAAGGDLARLLQERDSLLRTGNYGPDDKLVRRLNSEIERLSQGRSRPAQ